MDMTISQALRRISKLKGTIKENLDRAAGSITYNIAEAPAFSFSTSLEQAEIARTELIKLESALRITNSITKIDFKGRLFTLTEATCVLRESKGKIAWFKALNNILPQGKRIQSQNFWNGKENVLIAQEFKCELPEAQRVEIVQKEQELFDALNDAVESANHRTPLKS